MYSQKNEEEYVLRHAGSVGRFLDIGAFDGVQYSNTMALVERGWEGIMVEPSLQAFQALHVNHGSNEKLILVHAAVITDDFGDPAHRLRKFWPNARTFSTTEQSNTIRFAGEGFGPAYWTPGVTVDDLLLAFPGPVDGVSIDTEGTSVDLLVRLPMELMRPRVIVVEHDSRLREVEDWMLSNQYKMVVQNEENICLVPR